MHTVRYLSVCQNLLMLCMVGNCPLYKMSINLKNQQCHKSSFETNANGSFHIFDNVLQKFQASNILTLPFLRPIILIIIQKLLILVNFPNVNYLVFLNFYLTLIILYICSFNDTTNINYFSTNKNSFGNFCAYSN